MQHGIERQKEEIAPGLSRDLLAHGGEGNLPGRFALKLRSNSQ